MQSIADIPLVEASVDAAETFEAAARALSEHRLASVAVLEEGAVVGLFTDEELLLGISPRYLGELRHTAFLDVELPSLRERVAEVRGEPVRRHMRKPVTVQRDASPLHAAERFVHSDEAALAVVDDDGRFVGMLERTQFAHALLRHVSGADAGNAPPQSS